MAKLTAEVIQAIRQTAKMLEQSNHYQWGHMGSCNCGFLAQQITHLQKDEIHARAMQRVGDWNEQLIYYCPTSGLPMDELIHQMLDFGFDVYDLRHLEKLSDKAVLETLPEEKRNLRHNSKEDVVLYLKCWANSIESKLLDQIYLPMDLDKKESIL